MTVDLTHFNHPKAGGAVHKDHPDFDKHFGKLYEGGRMRDPNNEKHLAEDAELHRLGILDKQSLENAYQCQSDAMRMILHNKKGKLKAIRYGGTRAHPGNLRMNTGGIWICEQMIGGLNLGLAGVATASTATTLTSGAVTSVTTNQYAGHWLVAAVSATVLVAGKIISHTSGTTPVYTVDQWYSYPINGTVGTTPSATGAYAILPGRTPTCWIAFTTTASFTPNTTDTQGSGWANEVTTGGFARQFGTYSLVTNPVGSSTSTNQTATAKLHLAITATGTLNGIDGAGLFEFAGQGNGSPLNEGTLSSFNVISGDSATFDWNFQNN